MCLCDVYFISVNEAHVSNYMIETILFFDSSKFWMSVSLSLILPGGPGMLIGKLFFISVIEMLVSGTAHFLI